MGVVYYPTHTPQRYEYLSIPTKFIFGYYQNLQDFLILIQQDIIILNLQIAKSESNLIKLGANIYPIGCYKTHYVKL
jgi:hypothetical protein